MSGANTKSAEEAQVEWFLSSQEQSISLLYDMRDEAFSSPTGTLEEIPSRMRQYFDKTQEKLKSFSPDLNPNFSSKLKAQFHYVKGKLLNIFEEYNEEAEYNLLEAVKLNPHLSNAWLCLSLCDYKKGRFVDAKEKLEQASKLKGVPDHDILCELSVVKAKLVLAMLKGNADVPESMEHLCKGCIEDAKQASGLDLRNFLKPFPGKAWYCLENAYLINWFATQCRDGENLSQSMKAFSLVRTMKTSPYYRYNYALAGQYFGDYTCAVHGFGTSKCKDIDPTEELETIVGFLQKFNLESSLQTGISSQSSDGKKVSLPVLQKGPNRGKNIRCTVISVIKENGPLLLFRIRDSNQNEFLLTIYGVRDHVILKGSRLMLRHPYLHEVDTSWEGESYQFRSIFLDSLDHLELNGKSLKDEEKIDVVFPCSMHL